MFAIAMVVGGLVLASAGDSVPVKARANANLEAAGRLRNGVLTIRLEARAGRWYPEEDNGPSEVVHVFAEEGRDPTIPGPLLRVPEGTTIHAYLRNRLDSTLVLHGLHARPGAEGDSIVIGPGAVREVRFVAGAPGTYYYWGSTTRSSFLKRAWLDSQLSGAFVIDGKTEGRKDGKFADRIFVLGMWIKPAPDDSAKTRPYGELMVINGKMWPHTERFSYSVGDSVRWRWVNATESSHPMHLHGFYFRIDAHGDLLRDTALAGDARPFVNTELMLPGATMDIAWQAQREGNWVFHCHFAFHVSHWLTMAKPDSSADAHRHHRMSGLVIGMNVKPGPRPAMTTTAPVARHLRLVMQEAPRRYNDSTHGFGFILQERGRGSVRDTVASDSVPEAGPTMVLTRGQPVAITVVNRLRQQTGVHWHGIELESFPDGIPGWSGTPGRIMPPIAPGDSFVAEFVPPRSGTFLYHSHSNEDAQISSGLYGALIVVEPGHVLDPKRDLVLLLGSNGPFPNQGMLNGESEPSRDLELEAGTTYRLRLIQIQPDWRVHFSLLGDGGLAEWRPIAKDGADLPASRRVMAPARILAGPGETADFEFTPRRGSYRLEIASYGVGWHLPLGIVAR